MTQRLYNRGASLAVWRPNAGKFFAEGANVINFTACRISFAIEKTLAKEPNTSTVSLYNLSDTSAADLQAKPLRARLHAGYDGNLARLFEGDIRRVDPPRYDNDQVTTVTTLHLGDGDRAYRYAKISKSYAPGVTIRSVLRDIAGVMGGVLSPADLAMPELDKRYRTGVAFYGAAHLAMTRALDAAGLRWSIQDGRFQILREDGYRAEAAVLISADTGMIGQPAFGDPPAKGKPPVLKVAKLIDPTRPIIPGGLIQVASRRVNGIFKVTRLSQHGDTHDEDWVEEIEATTRKPKK